MDTLDSLKMENRGSFEIPPSYSEAVKVLQELEAFEMGEEVDSYDEPDQGAAPPSYIEAVQTLQETELSDSSEDM